MMRRRRVLHAARDLQSSVNLQNADVAMIQAGLANLLDRISGFALGGQRLVGNS